MPFWLSLPVWILWGVWFLLWFDTVRRKHYVESNRRLRQGFGVFTLFWFSWNIFG